MIEHHKRFYATILFYTAQGVAPLFDLIVYGATLEEAEKDLGGTKETLDGLLRKRNLSLDDFAGFALNRPMEMPVRTF